MSEFLHQSRYEDAIASANAFLSYERGTETDGDFASKNVQERISSVESRAEALLASTKFPNIDGLYVSLSKHNAQSFGEAAAVLPGYMVLVPTQLVDAGSKPNFYPAVVSEDGIKTSQLRLHVLKTPYRQQISDALGVALSAAGQSETKGIGEHGRKVNDGVEAEHFATLLAAGSDPAVSTAWQRGEHINHTWRKQAGSSVTTEMSKRLFGDKIPQQTTLTITQQQIEQGKAMLLWHEGMRSEQTGKPEAATKDKALVIIQCLGYEVLRETNPQGIDTIKRLIA